MGDKVKVFEGRSGFPCKTKTYKNENALQECVSQTHNKMATERLNHHHCLCFKRNSIHWVVSPSKRQTPLHLDDRAIFNESDTELA